MAAADSGTTDESAPKKSVELGKLGWWWFGSLLVCNLLGWILGWFDHTTTLTPDHSGVIEYEFIAGAVLGLISVVVIFWTSRGPLFGRLMIAFIVMPILSILGIFLPADGIATLIENRIDFPPEITRTFDGLLLISRAYQTHGKGRSWNIQTTPIWSNIDVTRQDYEYMQKHRGPGDRGSDPDEIASHGYFCAKVILQQAGQALRVLHAGQYALPRGTVGICSELIAAHPSLAIIN